MHRIHLILLIALLMTAGIPVHAALDKIPEPTLKIPPMVPERSVSTYIPSQSAPGQGLAVNVIYPSKPRYKDGAPVAVVVPGGEGASGLEFSTHTAQSGFVEVRFAFPGGGKQGFSSSGIYDYRGTNSQMALRDVLLFAGGKLKDRQERTISSLVPVKIDESNIGVIGWSNGGNLVLVTLSNYMKDLPFLGWLVFYETPLGSMFYPPSLGGAQDLIQNRHYRQGSAATGHCLVDYRKLCFQAAGQKSPGAHKKIGQPEVPGVLFFDENGNKQWDEELEFALPYCGDVGLDKQIYPPQVTEALARLHVFGKTWPRNVATAAESENYFQERDGSLYLNEVSKGMPGLLITVFGSQLDHLQRQPDHPHISLNYNGWLANKQKFVRLNPDPVYVGAAADMNPRNFVDNKPNSSVDASTIDEYLEPEGLIPDYVYIEAAAAELADRKKKGNFQETLSQPIFSYSNGAGAKSPSEAPVNSTRSAAATRPKR
jgi:hypothetical protein